VFLARQGILQWNTRAVRRLSVAPMSEDRPSPSPRLIIGLIMGGLAVWALYIAIGSYLYNFNPWRAVLVLGCMGVFLGFWLLLLWSQGGKKQP
jgi:drug/metabolite transporter (DMT)-like permease